MNILQNTQLGKLWQSLRASYWFVPTLMVAGAIILSFITLTIDSELDPGDYIPEELIYTGSAEGARQVLDIISGSMITVAGTVFSITIVSLNLASSQLGPRLLRNFMRDLGDQIVLGTFTATFIYCLLIIRTIRVDDFGDFIPEVSVTIGLLIAIVDIGVLIYFIHHTAQLIQADNVIANVAHELKDSIDRLFPQKIGHTSQDIKDNPQEDVPVDFEQGCRIIQAKSSGYLQAINEQNLLEIAKANELVLKINHRPGDFLVKGTKIVEAFPGAWVTKSLASDIHNTFLIGKQRTEQQDIDFVVNQLVEIAARSLSPGINDPFTAIRCIDRLCEGLCHFVEREIPSKYRYDDHQQLRIIADPITFKKIVASAFNQIRQNAAGSVAVRIRLLEAITEIATHTQNKDYHAVLRQHAKMIHQESMEAISESSDRQDIEEAYLEAIKQLQHYPERV